MAWKSCLGLHVTLSVPRILHLILNVFISHCSQMRRQVTGWYQTIITVSLEVEKLLFLASCPRNTAPDSPYEHKSFSSIYCCRLKNQGNLSLRLHIGRRKLSQTMNRNITSRTEFHTWRLPLHIWGSRGCEPQLKQYFGVTSGNCVMESVETFLNKTERSAAGWWSKHRSNVEGYIVLCLLCVSDSESNMTCALWQHWQP